MAKGAIIFSGPMVRAIQEGKTQTRRVIKQQPSGRDNYPPNSTREEWFFRDAYYACEENDIGLYVKCPYGKPGDRLYVKEAWSLPSMFDDAAPRDLDRRSVGCIRYHADGKVGGGRERSPLHMPRWASRITLEIVRVRVERVRDISEQDAIAEGVFFSCLHDAVKEYSSLWDEINGNKKGHAWADNPFVWVLDFKPVTNGDLD